MPAGAEAVPDAEAEADADAGSEAESDGAADGEADVAALQGGAPGRQYFNEHPLLDILDLAGASKILRGGAAAALRIAPDASRDVLAIECRLDGDSKLRVYTLLAPHLGATGYGNRAASVLYRRRRTLWAEHGPFGAALVLVDEKQRDAVGRASAGYVGDSDGWQDFARNGAMTPCWRSAPSRKRAIPCAS